jgi:putative DNA primase/helicase
MLSREEWEAAAKCLKALCEAHGLKADHSRTADISSCLRPPGTYNRKNLNAHRVVKLLSPLVGPYNTDEILEKLKCELPTKETKSGSIITSAERIAEQCPQVARLRDLQGNVTEPEWYAVMCVLAKCDDGEKLAHAWSKGYPRYSESETSKKLEHARRDSGPTTCKRFEEINKEVCAKCQYRGKITSPIVLGRVNLEIAGVSVPRGYRLTRDGVFQSHAKKGDVKLSGPAWIAGHTRNRRGGSWGHVVRWIDRDGNEHEQAIPASRLHEQAPTLAAELANEGLMIVPQRERILVSYLGSFNPTRRVESVSRLGWLDDPKGALAFVLPTEVITSGDAEDIKFQPERFAPTSSSMRAAGASSDWQERVAGRCQGNPLLTFALCAGFTGPLLHPLGLDSGGFHLFGTTSRGKTTALQVAVSVFGNGADPAHAGKDSMTRRWNTTANGAEGLAATHNDNLLALDELGTCSARDYSALLYMLTGGQGKAAMDANRNLKAMRAWRVLILSTGEISTRTKISEDRTPRGGQQVRLLDIRVPDDGAVADSHGLSAAEFIDELKQACASCYGTAGPAFVRALVKNFRTTENFVQAAHGIFDLLRKRIEVQQATPEQRRAVDRIAAVATAGLIASHLEIIKLGREDIVAACVFVRDLWVRDEASMADAVHGAQAVRDFALKNRARFAVLTESQQTTILETRVLNQAGYWDSKNKLFLFIGEAFQEACSGFDPKTVARELDRRGLLLRGESNRLTKKFAIPGLGERVRLYAVRAEVAELDVGPLV